MIETNNPGINVDELMQKIRQEVARRHELSVTENTREIVVDAISAQFNNIELLLNDAESNSQVPTKFPDKLNRFPFNISKQLQRWSLHLYEFLFKKQRVVNLPLIQAVRDSLALNRQLVEQITTLQVQVNVVGDHITTTTTHLSGIGDRITGTEKQVNRISDRTTATQKQVNQIDTRITATREDLSGIGERLTATESQLSGIGAQLTVTESRVSEVDTRITATREDLSRIGERLTATESQSSGIGAQLTVTESRVTEVGARITATREDLSRIGERLTATESQSSGMGAQITATESQLSGIGARFTVTESQLSGMGAQITATESQVSEISTQITATREDLSGIGARLTTTESQVSGMGAQITATESQVSGMGAQITATESQVSRISDRLTATDQHLSGIDERYTRNDSYLKNDLAQQKRLITLFLEEARKRLPEPFSQEQVQTLVNEDQHLLDAFYVAFEDRFRGSREEIIGRLIVYLPLIQKAKIGEQSSPILDVGCGRGEWLELLRQAGYTAHGLDINRVMIEQCQVRGLEVVKEDVISYLQSLPDASLGAVTGFHIIEHLPLPVLIKLLNETIRVLKPGGLAIFETPNPQNMLVGSNNFYMDPTHLNPLPNLLTKFLFENAGFESVEVMNLHPYPESFKVSGSEIAERFNDYFYGPQDYAVFGHKI